MCLVLKNTTILFMHGEKRVLKKKKNGEVKIPFPRSDFTHIKLFVADPSSILLFCFDIKSQ